MFSTKMSMAGVLHVFLVLSIVRADVPQLHIKLPARHERELGLDDLDQLNPNLKQEHETEVSVIKDITDNTDEDYDDDDDDVIFNDVTDEDVDEEDGDVINDFSDDDGEISINRWEMVGGVPISRGGMVKYDSLSHDDIDRESASGLHRLYRKYRYKRSDVTPVQTLSRTSGREKRGAAIEAWRETLPGATQKPKTNVPDKWEEITDMDLLGGKFARFKQIAEYSGMTLLSVFIFVVLGGCFIRDPLGFILEFGTGCPCCLLCLPCIRTFIDKYLIPSNVIKDSINKYMPGLIVKEDGSLEYYEPTMEELSVAAEIFEELTGVTVDMDYENLKGRGKDD